MALIAPKSSAPVVRDKENVPAYDVRMRERPHKSWTNSIRYLVNKAELSRTSSLFRALYFTLLRLCHWINCGSFELC